MRDIFDNYDNWRLSHWLDEPSDPLEEQFEAVEDDYEKVYEEFFATNPLTDECHFEIYDRLNKLWESYIDLLVRSGIEGRNVAHDTAVHILGNIEGDIEDKYGRDKIDR